MQGDADSPRYFCDYEGKYVIQVMKWLIRKVLLTYSIYTSCKFA